MRMSELVTVTLRIPKELAKELDARIEHRYRSEYIRQAIIDKLKKGSQTIESAGTDEIENLKTRISALEEAIRNFGKQSYETQIPAILEVVARDETDRKIINYIVNNKSATTKELERVVNLKRRMILERAKAIEGRYEEKFAKPLFKFVRGKKDGKRQAWWLADS
jgi:metal-responsive CopG/Arc/MetJ family transcriptional regulator